MAECDLCKSSDRILHPINVNPMRTQGFKHLCRSCIEQIQAMELPDDGPDDNKGD